MMAMSIMGLTSVGKDRDMVRSIIPMEICMLETGKRIRLRALGDITITMDTCTLLLCLIPSEPAATHVTYLSKLAFSLVVFLQTSTIQQKILSPSALRVHSIMAREAGEGSISCLVAESRYIGM